MWKGGHAGMGWVGGSRGVGLGWGIAGGRDGMGDRGGQDPTLAPLEDVAGGRGERGGGSLSHVPYLIRCIRIIIMAELGKDHPKSGGPGVDIRGSA